MHFFPQGSLQCCTQYDECSFFTGGFAILFHSAVGNILTASIPPLDTAHISKSVSVGRMEARHHGADRYGAVTPPLIKRRHSDSFSEARPPCYPPTQTVAGGAEPTRTSGADLTQKMKEKKKARYDPPPPGGDEAI